MTGARAQEDKTDGTVERRASRDQAQWNDGAARERERERERGGQVRGSQMVGRSRDREKGRAIGRSGRKLRHDETINRGLGEGQGKSQNRG